MRKLFAVWITKILILVGKIVGKNGSSTPGVWALKVCPDILKILAKQVKNDIIVVCGTNGKTTTNNIINSVFTSTGKNVVCNGYGANMLPGVVTAFVQHCNIFGSFFADYACLEVDELSTIKVFDHLEPDYVVVTNLFRDQLDRYGEIEMTLGYFEQALSKCQDTKLILNADDPLLVTLGKKSGKKCYYYGVSEDVGIALNEAKDGRFCLFCGNELQYEYYHYSQLGNYRCNKCSFGRPNVDFEAKNINLDNGIEFNVNDNHIDVKYRGFYNIYNILAAYSVVSMTNVSLTDFNTMLKSYKPQVGRMEEFCVNGKQVILNLSKNPAGFNQSISTVITDKRSKNIVIAVNDNPSDGIDVSWIWDVDFERLKSSNSNKFFVTGIRHNDLAVRFKYADFSDVEDVADLKTVILNALSCESDVVYIIANYTALYSVYDILKGLEDKK